MLPAAAADLLLLLFLLQLYFSPSEALFTVGPVLQVQLCCSVMPEDLQQSLPAALFPDDSNFHSALSEADDF